MKDWYRTSLAIAASFSIRASATSWKFAPPRRNEPRQPPQYAYGACAKRETEQRIFLLSAWREAPCYTDRERAALGWTEALTRLSEGRAHASAYEALKA